MQGDIYVPRRPRTRNRTVKRRNQTYADVDISLSKLAPNGKFVVSCTFSVLTAITAASAIAILAIVTRRPHALLAPPQSLSSRLYLGAKSMAFTLSLLCSS